MLSAKGPGEGEASYAALATLAIVMPSLDLRVVYSVAEWIDLEGRLMGGWLYRATAGARARLLDSEHLTLALRAGADGVGIVVPEGRAGIADAFGGLVASTGAESWQVTAEVRVPFLIRVDASGANSGRQPRLGDWVEAGLGVELPAVAGVNFLGQVTLWLLRSGQADPYFVIPFFTLGGTL